MITASDLDLSPPGHPVNSLQPAKTRLGQAQWQQRVDLLSDGHLVIPTGTGHTLFDAELRFPDRLLADAARFDTLVASLADEAAKPRPAGKNPTLPVGLLKRLAIDDADRPLLEDNYRLLCRLHDEGRDHIWSYYVRNLARPLWLSNPDNRVDVLVGNPPWLSYRHMPADMQATFREMSDSRGLWHGNEVATQQDLSGLFIARAVQQYLKVSGSFAFVVPNAVLDRAYFAGFRTGHYPDPAEPADVAFTGSWDLRRLRPHFFPRGSAVVFGTRCREADRAAFPSTTQRWIGKLPRNRDTWAAVADHVTCDEAPLSVQTEASAAASPYAPRFANGASIFPRVLFMVSTVEAGPLGLAAGSQEVVSQRSATEKEPWKSLEPMRGVVETEFIRPVLLGESVLPYRILPHRSAVLPLEGPVLISTHPRLDLYPGLADWWRAAEQAWDAHRSSEKLTLSERLDFHRGLTNQIPAAELRVVYAKSGMHVAAALVTDPRVVIDHTLYWGTVTSEAEGHYLCAILNSPSLTELVRPLMSYGKDERHLDKHLWKLPIPQYDSVVIEHQRLAELGQTCATRVVAADLGASKNFVSLRRQVRSLLAEDAACLEADEITRNLLDDEA